MIKDILRAVKDGGSADHVAQRARDEKARQHAHDQAVTALVEAGVTVIDRPSYDDKTIKELREIRMVKKDGDPKANPPTEKEHATCPGHAAYLTTYYSGTPHVTYVCTNPKANGHALSSWNGETRLPGQQPGGGMTEEQKAERRTLIANNKSWDSATVVRRAWMAETFVTRTTPPKGAETFLALAVAHGEHTEESHQTYADLTRQADDASSVPEYQRYWGISTKIEAKADAAPPRQVLMLALALLVCEWESTTSRNTWRSASARDRRYLTALIGWGYQPSDVERLILAQPDTTEPTTTEPTEAADTEAANDAGPTGDSEPTDEPTENAEPPTTAGQPTTPPARTCRPSPSRQTTEGGGTMSAVIRLMSPADVLSVVPICSGFIPVPRRWCWCA